ncbi:MAG: hypothetical protein N3D73_01745 [Candidatus Diapherotrites archaeon]|nr:hypothetical protein [Candidatus Diapherotrites archaeon]
MIEIDFVIRDLEILYSKEKSIKKRIFLEQAIEALKKYDKLKKEEKDF